MLHAGKLALFELGEEVPCAEERVDLECRLDVTQCQGALALLQVHDGAAGHGPEVARFEFEHIGAVGDGSLVVAHHEM